MMQIAPPTFGLTPNELLLAVATLFSMALNWRFAASVSSMKLEMKIESDKLREEISLKLSRLEDGFSRRFVPGDLAAEQRATLVGRVDRLETEVNKNRDRLHDLSNQFQTLMLGPMAQVQAALQDKARRMGAYEERSRAVDDQLRDLDEEIDELRSICKSK